jgi:hypothetical protein
MSSCARSRVQVTKKSRSDATNTAGQAVALPTKRQLVRRQSLTRVFNPSLDGRYALFKAIYYNNAEKLSEAIDSMQHVPQVAWGTLAHTVCLTTHRRDVIDALNFLIPQRTKQSVEDAKLSLTPTANICAQLTKSTMTYEYFSSATLRPPVRPLDGSFTAGAIHGIGFSDKLTGCPYDVLQAFQAIHTELRIHRDVRAGMQAAFAVIWADQHYKVTAARSSLGDPRGRAFGTCIKRALDLPEFAWSTTLRAEQAVFAQLAAIAQSFVPPRHDVVELCHTAFTTVQNQHFFNSYSLVAAIIVALMFVNSPSDIVQPNPRAQPLVQVVPSCEKPTPALSPEDWVLASHCVCDRNGSTAQSLLDGAQTEETGSLAKLDDRLQRVLQPAWQVHFAHTTPIAADSDDSSAHGSDEF